MTDANDWTDPYDDREPEPPEEQPVDLDEVEALLHKAALNALNGGEIGDPARRVVALAPQLLARLRASEGEVADWRGREQRVEYVIVRDGLDPAEPTTKVPRIYATAEMADEAITHPERRGGVPWARVITTSPWHRHTLPPF